MKRRKCIVCGSALFAEPLYICKNMPSEAQRFLEYEELSSDNAIDYEICQCTGCGLIQFNCSPVSYYLDSTRAGERSEMLVKMRREQYKHLIEKYKLNGKKIIEIGAGKGGFLKTLKEMREYDISVYGIENNREFVKVAREIEGMNVQQGNPEDVNTYIEGGPFDAFVSFAYPARLENPNSMLQLVKNNLSEDGIGLVQVPSLEHLLQPGGFFDITRDHIAYYDSHTLSFLLQKNGFDILEDGEIGDVYIYAIVKNHKRLDVKNHWNDVENRINQVKKFVSSSIANNNKLAVWCAGHFAFTVLSTAGIKNEVSYIIDSAKFKQNKFSPVSHIPIYGPEHYNIEPVDTILILGPIYVDEIVKEIETKLSSNIKIAVMDKLGIRKINYN